METHQLFNILSGIKQQQADDQKTWRSPPSDKEEEEETEGEEEEERKEEPSGGDKERIGGNDRGGERTWDVNVCQFDGIQNQI